VTKVATMQRGLEKALQRASLADDRELAGRVRDEGHRLVFLLNGLIRTSRLYQADNAALEGPATEFAGVLGGLIGLLGAVNLFCVEDNVYVNDVRLRVRPTEQVVIDGIVAELSRHNTGGVSFHGPVAPAEVKLLARALSAPAGEPGRARAALAEGLRSVEQIELTGRYRFRISGERHTVKQRYDEVLRRGASVVKEAVANLGANRLPNPLPVRRAVVDLVDSVRNNVGRAAATPLRRALGGAGDQHLLSVCNLSLLLGQALGLAESALGDLGVAAMLHDVGYAHGGDKATHAALGARLLLRQRGFHEGKIRRLRVVLEHHLPTGAQQLSLFSRILHIADDYDVLTALREGQRPGLPPPTAQGAMWAARGQVYDADLMALFVRLMGAYPPGSLLELSNGRWVMSVSGGRDQERFAWPVVRVIQEADGSPGAGAEELDLFELRYRLRPRRVLNPATKGLDIAEALERAFATP
jgi:HD domain